MLFVMVFIFFTTYSVAYVEILSPEMQVDVLVCSFLFRENLLQLIYFIVQLP